MSKKKVRRKIKVIPMIITLLIISFLLFILFYLLSLSTRNIFIVGNDLLSDQVIIDQSGLSNYPSFYLHTRMGISKRIKKIDLVENVKVRRKFFNVFEIEVIEKEILFKDSSNNYILKDGTSLNHNYGNLDIPILLNYVSDIVYPRFIENYAKIERDVRSRISEIKYDPSEYDQNRFLLAMNDGNYVYINLASLELLKHYDNIYASLEGNKGIIYCDSSYAETCSFQKFP